MNYNIGSPSNLSDSSSDDDDCEVIVQAISNNNRVILNYLIEENNQVRFRGSVLGHIVINHDRKVAHRNLFNEYFAKNLVFPDVYFRRRFRMKKNLFLRILNAAGAHDDYFIHKRDGVRRLGLSCYQKVTVVFQILAYGSPADATDEYIKTGESTAIESSKRFCRAIVERWNNCPTGWEGQYAGRSGSPIFILEAVADYDLWIWQAYFRLPGSNNDTNVLESSYLFANLSQGIAPPAHYVIQEKDYNMGYYLADGIYPKWSTLVQTIQDP